MTGAERDNAKRRREGAPDEFTSAGGGSASDPLKFRVRFNLPTSGGTSPNTVHFKVKEERSAQLDRGLHCAQ